MGTTQVTPRDERATRDDEQERFSVLARTLDEAERGPRNDERDAPGSTTRRTPRPTPRPSEFD